MDEKLIKEYNAMLPVGDSLESIVAKGKVEDVLNNAKLVLSGIKKDDFLAWKKDPVKFVCKHDPMHYEQLIAVGYHPQIRELMGVVYVKQPYGYGGGCGAIGSMEYVRFYVDWRGDGDFTDVWEDQGIGSVRVLDPTAGNSNKLPIEYAVKQRIKLPKLILEILEVRCHVRRVRAILSWNSIPPVGMPHWKPFWGNVVETNIRFHK